MTEPQLVPIKGGWAALGADFAVFGESKEDALKRFDKAVELHAVINERNMNECNMNECNMAGANNAPDTSP